MPMEPSSPCKDLVHILTVHPVFVATLGFSGRSFLIRSPGFRLSPQVLVKNLTMWGAELEGWEYSVSRQAGVQVDGSRRSACGALSV